MGASVWLPVGLAVVVFGPMAVLGPIAMWSEHRKKHLGTFERQRATAAAWMRQEEANFHRNPENAEQVMWWRWHVITEANPNTNPRLSFRNAALVFADLTQRGLLVPDSLIQQVEVEGKSIEIRQDVYKINPGREDEWQEIENAEPFQVLLRKYGKDVILLVLGAILGWLIP